MINDEELNLPPILLIYNGHGSHTTLSWIDHARTNNMILYCLPPHTTHRLQPLNVGCFGPLQIAWFNQCDEILDETGEGMAMKDVVFCGEKEIIYEEEYFSGMEEVQIESIKSHTVYTIRFHTKSQVINKCLCAFFFPKDASCSRPSGLR